VRSSREPDRALAKSPAEPIRPPLSGGGYARLRRQVVLASAGVALAPLVFLTVLNAMRYGTALRAEAIQPIAALTANAERTLEVFLTERRAALSFVVRDRPFDSLCDSEVLGRVVRTLNLSLEVDAFVDLGIIDDSGAQLCYWGPYDLAGRDYSEQPWFSEVSRRGLHVSEVFLGFRNVPHFVIATRHQLPNGGFYVLRATIDAELFAEQLLTVPAESGDDLFLISRIGVLQTPSRRFGPIFENTTWQPDVSASGTTMAEIRDPGGERLIVGTAVVENSPFVVVLARPYREVMQSWITLRRELAAVLIGSAILILGVILWGANQFVRRLSEVNRRRAFLMHQVEYSNKLASLGRLAAGVAHEVNNPLAIIGEKAGLMHDLVEMEADFPKREKLLGLCASILRSVDRCSTITHRLLGFARHMDVATESVDLRSLIDEVLGFLHKEAHHRDLEITVDRDTEIPSIESDRGQLQQVFLNIINNAFAAVEDGGHIDIAFGVPSVGGVTCSVTDNGVGISEDAMSRIFEPFYTTKTGVGTGLGLSVTYGIVKKLGGEIHVESTQGEGTRFTVILPRERSQAT
jgi:two-component system NtrC family sensor kinase